MDVVFDAYAAPSRDIHARLDRHDRAGRVRRGTGRRTHRRRRPFVARGPGAVDRRLYGPRGTGVGAKGGYLLGMKLDIIAQIVQILKDAPEVGAIEIRRGLFRSEE